MQLEGPLCKMSTYYGEEIRYTLRLGDDLLLMNALLGRHIEISFTGNHTCFCGHLVEEVYRQNFCRDCFFTKPEASPTIMRPELSRAHLGIEERDLEFEKRLQLQPHYVYLAKTDRIKVGVTRNTQMPFRWMDQGAKSAAILLEVPNRYIAGEAEVALKNHFVDKTSWQAMLKDDSTQDDLLVSIETAKSLLPEHLKQYIFKESVEWHFNYPIKHQIDKVKSIVLKNPNDCFQGELWGIRGQYLITEKGVFNVRSHSGYRVKMKVT